MTAGLVACGGGGSGETSSTSPTAPLTPQPVISGTLTASPATCVASEGAGDCVVTLNPATTGASAPFVIRQDGSTYSAASAVLITIQVGEQQSFDLKDGSTVLASATASASCAEGLVFDPATKRCTNPAPVTPAPTVVLRYDRVTVVDVGGYPGILDENLMPVKAKNETGYTVGGKQLWGCAGSTEPLVNGILLVVCRITELQSELRPLAYDVVTNTLKKYEGVLPVGFELTPTGSGNCQIGPKWMTCMLFCQHGETWGEQPFANANAWAVPKQGGMVYSLASDARQLWYRDTQGVERLLVDYNLPEYNTVYTAKPVSWMVTISH